MANNDLATVRKFIFCIWSLIRMERWFLQIIKKKLTSLDKFLQVNYHKTLNPPLKKNPPANISCLNPDTPLVQACLTIL